MLAYVNIASVGVTLAQALAGQHILTMQDEMYCVTPYGAERLTAFGLDYKVLQREQQLVVPSHIDWSERYLHIAGSLGAALTHRLFDLVGLNVLQQAALCV